MKRNTFQPALVLFAILSVMLVFCADSASHAGISLPVFLKEGDLSAGDAAHHTVGEETPTGLWLYLKGLDHDVLSHSGERQK